MKQRMAVMVLIILGMLIGVALIAGTNVCALEIKEADFTVGDYFDYEVDVSGLGDLFSDEGFEDVTKAEATMKVSITGSDTITVDGESVECWIMKMEVGWEIELVGDGEPIETMDLEMDSSVQMWMSKSDHVCVKSVDKTDMDSSVESANFSMDMESKDETTCIYDEIPEPSPDTIKVGTTWSEKEEYTEEIESRSRSRMDGEGWGDWEVDESEEEISETTKYEVISENEIVVPAGTFNVLKIETKEQGSTDYSYEYIDKHGTPVKMESYSDDVLVLEASLKDYQYEKAKDSDGSSDGFVGSMAFIIIIIGVIGFVLVIGLVVIIVIVMMMRSKKKKGAEQESSQGQNANTQTQQQYPPPPPPPPPTPPPPQ